MVEAIKKAQAAARKAQEKLYDGICTITEYKKVKDEKTKLCSMKEVVALEYQPCRISFSKISQVVQNEAGIKLFLSSDVTIQPGSKITVTQNGVTTDYISSGVPAVYATHQEIMLELFERWA